MQLQRFIVISASVVVLGVILITTSLTRASGSASQTTETDQPTTASASPVTDGRALSVQCSVCHGKNGISKDPEAPNLAGQPALYLEKTMREYKDGTRQDRRMSLIAQTLSVEKIKALAKWYSSFEVTVKVPEE